jgi:acyl-CoA synthetase (AMP-forming)/AMP-acid ligase II
MFFLHFIFILVGRRNSRFEIFFFFRPEYVCLWLGISKAGCVASLINFQLRSDSLVHSLLACQAKAIVVGDELVDVVDEIRAKLPFLPIFTIGERTLPSSISLPSGIIGLDRLLATMPVDLPTAVSSSDFVADFEVVIEAVFNRRQNPKAPAIACFTFTPVEQPDFPKPL